MTDDLEHRLGTAVWKLTEERPEAVSAYDADGFFVGIHTVTHEPLLKLLAEGTGITRGAASSTVKLPIDADALMMLDQISRTLGEWSKWIMFDYRRKDTITSLVNWYAVHVSSVRDRHLSDEAEVIATQTVEGWVDMIEAKFNPDEFREWEHPCPKCGARRIVVNDEERFAIRVNVTQESAECASCGARWEGVKRLAELRYLTNLFDTPDEKGVQMSA